MLKCNGVSVNSSRYTRNLKLKNVVSSGSGNRQIKIGGVLSTDSFVSNGDKFITTWDLTDSHTITLPFTSGDYLIDWGDGTTTSTQNNHVYGNGMKTVIITITGTINDWSFKTNTNTNKNQLMSINNLGNLNIVYGAFYNCEKLQYCHSVTPSLSSNVSYMFAGCNFLESLDVSKWDVSNVIDMSQMFNSCYVLRSLDVSKWNTSNVTNMVGLFAASQLISLDISNWDVSKVTDMSQMFAACPFLVSLDISNWNTIKVTNMYSMFLNCASLKNVIGFGTRNFLAIIYPGFGNKGFIGIFANSGLTPSSYDQFLIDLNSNPKLPVTASPIVFGARGVKYTSAATTARTNLVTPIASGGRGWAPINDGGLYTP